MDQDRQDAPSLEDAETLGEALRAARLASGRSMAQLSTMTRVHPRYLTALEQGEYTIDRPGKTPLRWHVPVSVRSGDGQTTRVLVDGSATVSVPGCAAPVLVNAGQKGYYRTLYAPQQFKALAASFAKLPVVDQMGVMLDAGALAAIGLQPEADSLDLAMQVPRNAAPELWQSVAGSLGGIDDMLKGNAKRQAAFRKFALAKLAPKFEQLGWDNRDGDSSSTKQLRSSLISTLGALGDAKVQAEARRRSAAALDVDLVHHVALGAAQHPGPG